MIIRMVLSLEGIAKHEEVGPIRSGNCGTERALPKSAEEIREKGARIAMGQGSFLLILYSAAWMCSRKWLDRTDKGKVWMCTPASSVGDHSVCNHACKHGLFSTEDL